MAEEYWEEMLQEKSKAKDMLGTNIGCCCYTSSVFRQQKNREGSWR